MLKMINEFSAQTVSVDNRIDAIQYYTQEITSSFINFIFGRGMVYDQNTRYLYVLFGPSGNFNRSDIGALGFVDKFGLIGFMWYISVIVICFNSYYKSRKCGDHPLDLLALLLYFILGSATLCMMDSERNIMFPILIFASVVYRQNISCATHLERVRL